MFNSLNGLSDLQYEKWIIQSVNNRVRDNNNLFNLAYTCPVPKVECHSNSYFPRVDNLWNRLPVDIKSMDLSESENNKAFKRCVTNLEKLVIFHVNICVLECSNAGIHITLLAEVII